MYICVTNTECEFTFMYVNHPRSDIHNKPVNTPFKCVCVQLQQQITHCYNHNQGILNISIPPKVSSDPVVFLSSPMVYLTSLTAGNHLPVFCPYRKVCISQNLFSVWDLFSVWNLFSLFSVWDYTVLLFPLFSILWIVVMGLYFFLYLLSFVSNELSISLPIILLVF